MLAEAVFSLPPEIVSAIISACGVILSAIIAFLSAKSVANKEIKKMKMQWSREDSLSDQQAFSEMLSAVSRYLQSDWSRHQREALEKISAIRGMKGGKQLEALDALHASVLSGDKSEIEVAIAGITRLRQSGVNNSKNG